MSEAGDQPGGPAPHVCAEREVEPPLPPCRECGATSGRRLLTVPEAAALIRYSARHTRRLVEAGRLKGGRDPGATRSKMLVDAADALRLRRQLLGDSPGVEGGHGV